MATLRRNVLTNLLASAWTALLTLVITPVQVSLLGVEAYAIIGVIATLQLVIGIFDLGLSSTLTREVAVDCSDDRLATVPLVRTAITIYWCMAVLIGAGIYLAAGPIARAWLDPHGTSHLAVDQALQVIAVFLALRWPVAMYTGVLAGVQRMDVLNMAKSALVALRLLGGLVVIILRPELAVFLWWIVFTAFVEVIVFAILCHQMLPDLDWRPGFSFVALRGVWGFSLNMNLLAILSIVLTQVDRVLISRMLSLEALGFYLLAWQAATTISVVLAALSSALMPSLAAAHGAGDRTMLLRRYDVATRVLLFMTGALLHVFLFFGEPLLRVWIGADAALNSWRALALVATGLWLSSACSAAYQSAIASGRAGLILKISVASVVPYLIGLYVAIGLWGITGAALACLLLHLGYVATVVPTVHRHVLKIPMWGWYRDVVFPFLIVGVISFGGCRFIASLAGWGDVASLTFILPAATLYLVVGQRYAGASVRSELQQFLRYLGERPGMAR